MGAVGDAGPCIVYFVPSFLLLSFFWSCFLVFSVGVDFSSIHRVCDGMMMAMEQTHRHTEGEGERGRVSGTSSTLSIVLMSVVSVSIVLVSIVRGLQSAEQVPQQTPADTEGGTRHML